jgi:succinyl-CoA:acetate CoA-transferase
MRIGCEKLRPKTMSAEEAAGFITSGSTVGMSGFTGSGYPKAVPLALADRIKAEQAHGERFRLRVWTGASTGPELDGALAKVDAIEFRLPYNSDPLVRERINAGTMDYFDLHLSQVAPLAWQGFLGSLDIAVIEVTGIRPDGGLIPSSSVGNNKTWLDRAQKVILEVNSWQNQALEGMHDIYYGTALPPHRIPIPLTIQMTGSASRASAVIPTKSFRLWKHTRPIAIYRSRRRTKPPVPSPDTCSNSCTMRWQRGGCRQSCCRCNPAWAMSPMR